MMQHQYQHQHQPYFQREYRPLLLLVQGHFRRCLPIDKGRVIVVVRDEYATIVKQMHIIPELKAFIPGAMEAMERVETLHLLQVIDEGYWWP